MRPDTLVLLTLSSVMCPETPDNNNNNNNNNKTPVFDSIAQCCSLGEYRAKAQEEACHDLSVPATDIVPELQARAII